jgi:hypothetical protein
MLCRVAGLMVTLAVWLTEPIDAVIVLDPGAMLTTNPVAPTAATEASDELQCTVEVMSCVELSLKVPIAVS